MQLYKALLNALAASAIVGLLSPAPALAGGFYIGGGVYLADNDIGDDTVPGGFIGYTFVDTNFVMLSAEAGYYDLGDSTHRNQKAEASAYTAGGVVAVPLFSPIFEVYAKAGVAFADVKTEDDGLKNKDNDEKAYYGIGASLDILDTIDIYIEYLEFDTSINSNTAGVGIKLSF